MHVPFVLNRQRDMPALKKRKLSNLSGSRGIWSLRVPVPTSSNGRIVSSTASRIPEKDTVLVVDEDHESGHTKVRTPWPAVLPLVLVADYHLMLCRYSPSPRRRTSLRSFDAYRQLPSRPASSSRGRALLMSLPPASHSSKEVSRRPFSSENMINR
jgi:hypothetical protein